LLTNKLFQLLPQSVDNTILGQGATMKDAHLEYQANQVETADPRQLVIMLYDGAIRFLDKALINIQNFKKYDEVNQNILRAQDIITELMVSLDMEKGGEIANNLMSLYSFMKKEILNANIQKEGAGIRSVIKMLKELKSAWEQMDLKGAPQVTPGNPMLGRVGGFVAEG
jgi:flagellar protein FliS